MKTRMKLKKLLLWLVRTEESCSGQIDSSKWQSKMEILRSVSSSKH